MNRNFLIIANIALMCILFALLQSKRPAAPITPPPLLPHPTEPDPTPVIPEITNAIPTRTLSQEEINALLAQWCQQAPEIAEMGTYGNSAEGRPIKYIRIGKKTGPKVLITACIHGNEKLSAMTSLGCIGTILASYGRDPGLTNLIDSRDLYYVPVVCPDGYYRNTRHEGGLDPNRNWSGRNLAEIDSIPSIAVLKKFHLENKFLAVMSCHNYGKVFFYPWGYAQQPTEIDAQYRSILSEMCMVSGYNFSQLHRRSLPPYHGYETDWFHSKGAFAIVNEIGRTFAADEHSIMSEVQTNLPAFLIFIDKAPLVRGGTL